MQYFKAITFGLALLTTSVVSAQSYPDKTRPIRLIVPYAVGTSTDLLGRAIARGIADTSGLNVVVDNRPGGEGIIGGRAVQTATPDGYTFLLTTISTQAINPHMMKSLPYDPIEDLVPLVGVAQTPLMMNIGPSSPGPKVQDFIEAARKNPNKYTIGSGSATTLLAGQIFQRKAGIELLSVPYKNLTDAMSALASGQLDTVIVDAATAGLFYKMNVRPIAVTASARTSLYPDVPTLQEEGIKDYEVVGWFASYAPVNIDPQVAQTLRDIINKALDTKYVTDVRKSFAMEPLNLSGDALNNFQRSELKKWGEAVRAANLGQK